MSNPYFCDSQIIMFEFLKTLLIILWVYYALRLVMRWIFPKVLPWLMQQLVKKAMRQEQFTQPNGQRRAQNQKSTKPKSKKVVGEYIDFEEIED